MREASRPTEEVLESAPNATTSDDRGGGSVRIPLAGERDAKARERESERRRNRTRVTSEPPPRAADEKDPTRRRRRKRWEKRQR